MPTQETLQQLFARKKQQQPKVNVLAETFRPSNLLQAAKTVGKTIFNVGKEFITPTRSERPREEILQAKPTLKEKALGVARFGGEILDVAETVGHALSKPQRILVQKLFPDFYERNEQQRDEIKKKLQEFNIPKTAGEEQVMKIADIASFLPAGVLKGAKAVVGISKIAKSVKAVEIAEHLKSFNIAEEIIPKISKILEGVNTEKQVANIVRTAEITTDIIKKTGQAPPPQVLAKIGERLDEFSVLAMDKRERVIKNMVDDIIESAPKPPLQEGGKINTKDYIKVYHGSDKADIIEKEGFKKMPIQTGVSAFGDGSYLTTSKANAKGYGGGVVEGYLPKDIKLKKISDSDAYKIDTQKLIKEGYDGVELETGNGKNITIFDPSKIKTKTLLSQPQGIKKFSASKILDKQINKTENIDLLNEKYTGKQLKPDAWQVSRQRGIRKTADEIMQPQGITPKVEVPKVETKIKRLTPEQEFQEEINIKKAEDKENAVKIAMQEEKNASILKAKEVEKERSIETIKQEIAEKPELLKADDVIKEAEKKYNIQPKEKYSIFKSSQKEAITATTKNSFKRGVEKLLTPISTRMGNIAPELKPAIRRLDYDTGIGVLEDTKKTLPFLREQKKLSISDREIFDLARKNGDEKTINAIAEKYGFSKQLDQTRKVLDDIYERANGVGMDVQYRGNYFPRIIKDPEGFMNYLHGTDGWSIVEKAIAEKAGKLGIKPSDLSIEEKAGIINSLLRGYGNKITLSLPGFAKEREIEFLTQDLNKFYEKTDASLVSYIVRMNEEIAARKFFGKELGVNPSELNASDSIGAYVMKLVADGKIKPSQEKEISDILKARFHKGRMNEALQTFRNVEYLSTMGNPISAITQIGDFGWSLAENGFYGTTKGLGKSLFGAGIKKEDLGIEIIAQEFTEPSKTAKLVNKVFKLVGLDKIDRLGKETFVNGYWDKIQGLAKKGDKQLIDDFKVMFGKDADNVLKDTANGKLTDDTKFALFSRLADFQPISKSEMPEKYLASPNGRIFYMLKSFTLKQVDVFRRESISKIISGTPKEKVQGVKRLVALGGMFMLANATSDEIKDLVLGRKTSTSDRVVDNLVRLGGLSKFDIYKIREEGLGVGLAKKILFPTSIADAVSKDIENVVLGKEYKTGELKGQRYKYEIPQRVPLVGKMYYWWFGRGAQKEDYKESKETKQIKTTTKKIIPSNQITKKKIIPTK